MSNIKVEIKNLDKFMEAMIKSPQIVSRRMQNAIEKAGNVFLRGTKENIRTGTDMWKPPINTGFMWNNIFLNIFPLKAEIRPTASYAVYVHEGTSRMQSRPFLEITERTENDEMQKIFTDELDQAMNEIARNG